jgi:hypothetical protein
VPPLHAPRSQQGALVQLLTPRPASAVGDLHGDWRKAIGALSTAGVISLNGDDEVVWIGGDTTVVQLGDVLDRGDHEIGECCLPPHTGLGPPRHWWGAPCARMGASLRTHMRVCLWGGVLCCARAQLDAARGITCVHGISPTLHAQCAPLAAIVKLLRDLDEQARPVGGAVYMLNGNHESLNVCGDFR